MEDDFMKRGYLLPEGYKDLIDVLEKPKQQSGPGGCGSGSLGQTGTLL